MTACQFLAAFVLAAQNLLLLSLYYKVDVRVFEFSLKLALVVALGVAWLVFLLGTSRTGRRR